MRNTLRAVPRGARLIVHLFSGIAVAAAVRLSGGRLAPEPVARWWSLRLLRILNIRLSFSGEPVAGARVTVSNHVSWLDIPVVSAGGQCRFVSKSEVRHWPIAGLMANAAGTFFIRRGKGGARPLLARLTPHLAAGGDVALFPEGTTTDGSDVLPFHARLFAAAIDAQVPVQPIALRYGPAPDGSHPAPFIGDDDLVRHILRLLRCPGLDAELIYCAPIAAQDRDRDMLARLARRAIQGALAPETTPAVDSDLETRPRLAA